jgi:hypothetical protein
MSNVNGFASEPNIHAYDTEIAEGSGTESPAAAGAQPPPNTPQTSPPPVSELPDFELMRAMFTSLPPSRPTTPDPELAQAANTPLPHSRPTTPESTQSLRNSRQSSRLSPTPQLNQAPKASLHAKQPPRSTLQSSQQGSALRPASAPSPQNQAATLNLFAGKTLGEISNVLSEASSFLTLQGQHGASNGTGLSGESLFAIGGIWSTGAAGQNVADLFGSASTPEQKKELIEQSVELMRGLASTLSGLTGVVAATPNGNEIASKISSAAWAVGEGLNAGLEASRALSNGTLNKEQLVHLGQIAGSSLKFAGIVASLAGASGNGPIIAQAVGSGLSISSGALNLQHKGYDVASTISSYANSFVGHLGSMARSMGFRPARTAEDEAYEMV